MLHDVRLHADGCSNGLGVFHADAEVCHVCAVIERTGSRDATEAEGMRCLRTVLCNVEYRIANQGGSIVPVHRIS